MVFLTSKSASKHVFALDVDPSARDTGEGGSSDLVSQATPFAVLCETSSCPCLFATRLVLPSLATHQSNGVEFTTKVLFSLFGGSEVIARLTSGMIGKLCNVYRLRNLRLA